MAKRLNIKTTNFLKILYPTVEKNLASKSSTIINAINRFIDRNSSVLYDKGPSQRLFFKDSDRDVIYSAIGISPIEIKKCIDDCDFIKDTWQVMNNPFNLAMCLVTRYFTLKKNKKGVESSVIYLALQFYSSIQSHYFKYKPNEACMEYTISNMSNKYLLKQTGNIFGAVFKTAMTCYENFQEEFKDFYDEHVVDYIMAVKTRENSLMLNIFKEYKKNADEGKYLNFEQDDQSEENFYEVENTSAVIINLTNATLLKVNSKAIDNRIIKLAAGMAGCSQNATRTALISIISNNNNEIKKVVNLIIELFLTDPNNHSDEIGSQKFINFCWNIYIKSNTKDKSVIEIKNLLDKWLQENSKEYQKTERAATKGNFRKAIYLYFVFMIQQTYIHK